MAQVSVGKLLPNLKVTLGNDTTEVETSEDKNFDISEKLTKDTDDSPNVEIVRSWMESLQNPKVYKNKSGGFTTGLDLISEENTELLSKRAERFGLEKEESYLAPNITELYKSMGITTDNRNSAKMKNMRLDALHMRGVNDMSTNEIFSYFKDYGPASVEWINDFSCNVVWLDEASCARALLGVSKPLSNLKISATQSGAGSIEPDMTPVGSSEPDESIPEQEQIAEEHDETKGEASMDVDDDSQLKSGSSESSVSLDIPVPPGHWRLGMALPKAKSILLRFATKDDKKLPGAEKRSDYYKKYGNPNYGGLKGLISSSRKRKMQAASTRQAIEVGSTRSISLQPTETLQSDVPVQRVSVPRAPRMRMYADDEELKTRKLRSCDSLRTASRPASIHSRLGNKYTKDDLCHLGSYNALDHGPAPKTGDRKRHWSSSDDLRSKLRRLRSDYASQHRSPLCVDSD